jgi:hypothetical protein
MKTDVAAEDAEATEKRYKKIHNIINETFQTWDDFSKQNPNFLTVMKKLDKDQQSDEYEIFKRNRVLIDHLERIPSFYSGGFLKMKKLLLPANCHSNYLEPSEFDGTFFDMEYVDPTNKKYFKYVGFVAFLLKCQKNFNYDKCTEKYSVEFWKNW